MVTLADKSSILQSTFTAVGACVRTKTLGAGVLVGYKKETDMHVVRFPHLSTTGHFNRSELLGFEAACPELPCVTPYGIGTVVGKSYGVD